MRDALQPNWLTAEVRLIGCRRGTAKQALGAQIFIHVWRVNPVSCTGDLPVGPLLEAGAQKARVPDQRDDARSAIGEIYSERVLGTCPWNKN
jgi:hypothetical protein